MFRKTDTNEQLDIFSSPSTYMKGRAAKKYEDPHAWHNEFYQYVTSKIDEETFRPLFKEGNMGAPNASIRIHAIPINIRIYRCHPFGRG